MLSLFLGGGLKFLCIVFDLVCVVLKITAKMLGNIIYGSHFGTSNCLFIALLIKYLLVLFFLL